MKVSDAYFSAAFQGFVIKVADILDRIFIYYAVQVSDGQHYWQTCFSVSFAATLGRISGISPASGVKLRHLVSWVAEFALHYYEILGLWHGLPFDCGVQT